MTDLNLDGLTDAQLRLFAVRCARRVQHLMTDPRSIAALDVAERYTKGEATDEELEVAWDAAWDVVSAPGPAPASAAASAAWAAAAAASDAAGAAAANVARVAADAASAAERGEQRKILEQIKKEVQP